VSPAALRISDLAAGYGRVPALHGISLHVEAGELVALLGANGAGKTTTMLSIAGELTPMAGQIEILGHPAGGRRPFQVARLGLALVPENRGIFPQLTVAENLRVRLRDRKTAHVTDEVFDHFPALRPLTGRKAGLLSGGEQQMLGLGCALVARPGLLLIDELSHGLAPVVLDRLLPVLRAIATDRQLGVLLVEQHVAAALSVADRGYVLSRGRVVTAGTAEELRARADLLEASYLGGIAPLVGPVRPGGD
jgi:branched-chain amino acid transport system ATP-binding protein